MINEPEWPRRLQEYKVDHVGVQRSTWKLANQIKFYDPQKWLRKSRVVIIINHICISLVLYSLSRK